MSKFQVGDWVKLASTIVASVTQVTSKGYVCRLVDGAQTLWLHSDGLVELWRERDWVILHLGHGGDIRPACINLDPRQPHSQYPDWRFENLPWSFEDSSINGITISHAWQCIDPKEVYQVAAELNRVLVSGGVVRITDDNTESSKSPCYAKLAPGAKNFTGPLLTRNQLIHAGFKTREMQWNETWFPTSILNIYHRERKEPRYVFYIEGRKEGKVKYHG